MENLMGNPSLGFSPARVTAEVREDDIGMEQNQEAIDDEGKADKDGDEKLVKIFGNHVIADRIMSYLEHTSIKFLSQTCQMLLRIVRGNRDFVNRTKISIIRTYERPAALDATSLEPSNFPWKNVTVDVNSWSLEERQAILLLLPQVESLEVYDHHVAIDELLEFLGAAESLTELTLGAEVLKNLDQQNLAEAIRPCVLAKANLEKLKSLRIQGWMGGADQLNVVDDDPSQNISPSLTQFSKIPTALTSFTFVGIRPFATSSSAEELQILKAISTILEMHKVSIRSLSLESYNEYLNGIDTLPFPDDIVFPALKELTLWARSRELSKVATFLAKQPPLESLSLSFGDSPVPQGRPLLTPLVIHGPTLKKFTLSWSLEPFQPPPPPTAPWDFAFLQNFVSLRELKIHQFWSQWSARFIQIPFAHPTSPATILSTIPDGVKTINLSGWTSDSCGKDVRQRQVTIESLGRFRNLTTLNLIQCVSILDDESLAFIFSNIPQLREFGFSHCNGVTDLGLTGKKQGESVGPGIQALTGLIILRIMCCAKVTNKGLLASISFRDLKFLTLLFEQDVRAPPSFYMGIAAQNKSLEVLEISRCPQRIIRGLRGALKGQSQRFRQLKLKDPPPPRLNRVASSDEEAEYSEADVSYSFGS